MPQQGSLEPAFSKASRDLLVSECALTAHGLVFSLTFDAQVLLAFATEVGRPRGRSPAQISIGCRNEYGRRALKQAENQPKIV